MRMCEGCVSTGFLKLQEQVVVSFPLWVLETKLWSSAEAAMLLNTHSYLLPYLNLFLILLVVKETPLPPTKPYPLLFLKLTGIYSRDS